MKKKMSLAQRINIVRAAVMGANDGIISVAGIVLGVTGANESNFAIFLSGIAGMLAGTVSMAMGEYVSVSTQKDSQKRAIIQEKEALRDNYQREKDFLMNKYLAKGINPKLVDKATDEMLEKNGLVNMVRERYAFNLDEYTSPYAAAIASMISFPLGSLLPLLAIILAPVNIRVPLTFIAVLVALVITGYSAAKLNRANVVRGVGRNVVSGMLTMLVTYLCGMLVG